ncbi:hypothetical protein CC77DRAFT_1053368 [Alternaria alternata]|uniref:Uncharacterized protein n=2 Tax=Alternaria alternata complex TaxID=187734 RepID=A0A177DD27_ALTAL|nr:hypothetical protein CC77DRAFT_1053368 [Alternaria alternata]OAG16739.1 hypothetical protein CC77DRAFT_1053368 [Alternaria alternata]
MFLLQHPHSPAGPAPRCSLSASQSCTRTSAATSSESTTPSSFFPRGLTNGDTWRLDIFEGDEWAGGQKDISRQLESGGQAEGKALAGAVYGLHSGLPARDNFALRRAFVMQMVQRTTTQTLQLELSRSLSSDLSLLAIIASSAHYSAMSGSSTQAEYRSICALQQGSHKQEDRKRDDLNSINNNYCSSTRMTHEHNSPSN